MDLNYIKKLLKILDSSNVEEIEIEEQGMKIRIAKPSAAKAMQVIPHGAVYPEPYYAPEIIREEKTTPAAETASSDSKKIDSLYEVKSPMVGTFYRAPSPDADPYVNVGSSVTPGSVLCIIEAMKLMNEIESEISGKIVKVLVDNAQPVEYNQPLFLIEKN